MSHIVTDVRLTVTCGWWGEQIVTVDADIDTNGLTGFSVTAICIVDGAVVDSGPLTASGPSGSIQTYSGTFYLFATEGQAVVADAVVDYQQQDSGRSNAVSAPDCTNPPSPTDSKPHAGHAYYKCMAPPRDEESPKKKKKKKKKKNK